MRAFKSWFVALGSRVDGVMTQIENQEGMVNAAIRKTRDSVAKAQIQLNRVHQDGVRLQEKWETARDSAVSWRQRARDCMDQDEQKAIECMRRSKGVQRDAAELEKRLSAHRSAEGKLREDVTTIKKRLEELVEKRNLMRTRQTRAEAQRVAQHHVEVSVGEIEEIFDRWEEKVTVAESLGGFSVEQDSFEQEFLDEEEQATLREELAALKRSSPDGEEKGERP
ncbi:MAG: hypothetical protein C0616_01505 [Desulfuromonas sp.]|nr:MAG: hypothetical protein C0616_01505 [Desulfuromonas sp.]